MSSDEKSLKSAIEEAVALEEAGNLEESLSKWKEIRAVKDTPNAALRHGCLARELKKWDEAELAGLAGMQLDRAASFDSRQGRYESLVRQEGGLREEPPVFMRVSINLAEREGYYLPSFRKLRRCLDFNDIILYSCVFQADSQSTFRVLASTPGYSQHHVKRKESVSVVSPKQPHDVKKSRDVPPFRPCLGRTPEYPSWWTEAVSNRSAVAFK